ncbi:MAG: hypothetical protein CMH31_02780 [Micavibrio sp.]|nr:hypothetical protein [Micavibrio sp.]|tara:strand:+ start:560 stop:1117 length:558 start_codon:yes stop_codon:yes gene_type:complete
MVFKRNKRPSLWQQTKNFFWPSMGWKRSFSYIKHRAIRLNDSNYAVAAGLAFGCSISFAPTLLFHIIQALLLCFIFRANYIAAVFGTIFGNPWTFPFLFLISYKVGWFLMNIIGIDASFPSENIDLSWEVLKEDPFGALRPYLVPMLIGGYIMALITFPVFYGGFYVMVRSARLARQQVIKNKKK